MDWFHLFLPVFCVSIFFWNKRKTTYCVVNHSVALHGVMVVVVEGGEAVVRARKLIS